MYYSVLTYVTALDLHGADISTTGAKAFLDVLQYKNMCYSVLQCNWMRGSVLPCVTALDLQSAGISNTGAKAVLDVLHYNIICYCVL